MKVIKRRPKPVRPTLQIKDVDGWLSVKGIYDVKAQKGRVILSDHRGINGDLIIVDAKYLRDDVGQAALRKLADMEDRIVDLRVVGEGASRVEMSVIVTSIEDAKKDRYKIVCRCLGMRPIDAIEPTAAAPLIH